MKKLFLTISALLLTAVVLMTCAFAAAPAKLTVSSAAGAPGQEVTLTVDLANNPGIAGMNFIVRYDEKMLELKSLELSPAAKAAADLSAATVSTRTVTFASMENYTGSGALATMRFRILDNAAPGSYPVTLEVTNLRDSDENLVDFGIGGGTVTVKEASHTHSWSAWSQTKAPSCTEKGEETRTCSGCGEKETRELAALGHTWTNWSQTKAPTYTQPGEEYRECSRCHEWETREIPALTGSPLDAVKILQGVVGLGPDTGYTPADAAAILG